MQTVTKLPSAATKKRLRMQRRVVYNMRRVVYNMNGKTQFDSCSQKLTAMQFLKLYKSSPGSIKNVRYVPAKLGSNSLGRFVVDYIYGTQK